MTTGIVVAAGLGSRMPRLTADRPKAMLPIGGRPLLHNTLDQLRAVGCDRLVVITGYLGERIEAPGAEIVRNRDYRNNNILHSLMSARDYLHGPVIVSYSDIWIEPLVVRTLVETEGDIILAVDSDWMPYYEGREQHPLAEAENVYYDEDGCVVEIGKHLLDPNPDPLSCGEFLGLWRMSTTGTARFVAAFDAVNDSLALEEPFQQATTWQRAYITDLIQEMVDAGQTIRCALVRRGWAELDTEEDVARLPQIAGRQRLDSLVRLIREEVRVNEHR